MKAVFKKTSGIKGLGALSALYNVLSSPVEANEESLSQEPYVEINTGFLNSLKSPMGATMAS